jgi:ribose 1,5-bisphosphate isomerase
MTDQDVRTNLVPAVKQIIAQFKALELHAARAGRDVMDALAETALLSPARDLPSLVVDIEAAITEILAVMPAYAPPLNVMHRVLTLVEQAQANGYAADKLRATIKRDVEDFHRWSNTARGKIAAIGAELIPDGGTVFTFTLSETALRTLQFAAETGKQFRLLVTESRPNRDGLHTARELAGVGIEVEVSIDACAGQLMPQADLTFIGAESIQADGSAVAKIGTYPVALIAAKYGVPVYIAVDTLKFDVSSMLGVPLSLDSILREDVLSPDMPPDVRVVGHLFDQTPSSLIRGIVTERGLISPKVCSALMRTMPVSQRLGNKLANRSRYPKVKH